MTDFQKTLEDFLNNTEILHKHLDENVKLRIQYIDTIINLLKEENINGALHLLEEWKASLTQGPKT